MMELREQIARKLAARWGDDIVWTWWLEHADVALEVLRQQKQEAVQHLAAGATDEATPEMEQAAEKYWNERKFSGLSDDPRTWKGLYAAMRAAAPEGGWRQPIGYAPRAMLDQLDIGMTSVSKHKNSFRNVPLYTASGAPAAVPEGWQLVPEDLTPEMVRAMEQQWMCGSQIDMAKREWTAALAAAPKQEGK